MGRSIQPLSTELIYRIAAGEVIDSLSAVVRELIDNALDAGATRIQIGIWPGRSRVQVADNGCGLAWDDLLQAVLPHTTSKIATFEQLGELHTLGFRGEALHSLAQLGELDICSRSPTGSAGWRVTYDCQGAVTQAEEIAIAPGTTVTVDNLFQNWPSRQSGSAKSAPVLKTIQAMIGDYALCHPSITWQIYQEDRPWFNLAPGQSAKDILLQLIPKLSPDALQHHIAQIKLGPQSGAESEPQIGTLDLLIGLPERYHRHRADWIRVAVNGRRVLANPPSTADPWTLGPLEQCILNAFRQTVPRHRYPLCWVHLGVPTASVDWNRTASKSHIYLHHLEDWCVHITQGIHQALDLSSREALQDNSSRVFPLLKTAEAQGRYAIVKPVSLSSPLPGGLGLDPDGLEQGTLRAIAQLHQTYILAEHPSGLWLVEQHIAHERILYEQLCQNWQLIELATPLMLPNLSERQVQNLIQMGLQVEPFGSNLWTVRNAPSPLAERTDCLEALQELSDCAALQPALVATACRSAIRNGQPLSLSEMQTLLNQWQQTQQPRTCPHGRPIYLALEETALSRFFRRHWVIGKSHGV